MSIAFPGVGLFSPGNVEEFSPVFSCGGLVHCAGTAELVLLFRRGPPGGAPSGPGPDHLQGPPPHHGGEEGGHQGAQRGRHGGGEAHPASPPLPFRGGGGATHRMCGDSFL